jgi:hypothetical protein
MPIERAALLYQLCSVIFAGRTGFFISRLCVRIVRFSLRMFYPLDTRTIIAGEKRLVHLTTQARCKISGKAR